MKEIYIGFSGFWGDFDIHDNIFVNILKKKYLVRVINIRERKNRKNVQYLFYSVFSDEYLEFDCIRIFYTGENLIPDFNLCDYALGFSDITFGDRYLRYPIYCWYKKACSVLNDSLGELQSNTRTKFCAMVISAPYCQENYRERFFRELSEKYRQVDSGGRYLNNIGLPEGVEDKLKFLSEYRFSFAFENVSYPGYCTEKIVESFAAGTIPIYWGDPNIEEYFNPDAFINCQRYSTIDQVIEKIIQIDQDSDLYRKMIRENPLKNRENYSDKEYDIKLEKWLDSIFSQEFSNAFRRNCFGIGGKYEENMRVNIIAQQRKRHSVWTRIKIKIKKLIKTGKVYR